MMDALTLYDTAKKALAPIALRKFGSAGHVACALETGSGAVFTGICIDLPCSLGFCAEQAAIAQMLKTGETRIRRIAAVYKDGHILPPCGRCREFIAQLDEGNMEALVVTAKDWETPLRELLPERWDRLWD